jgi:hypothetical protein
MAPFGVFFARKYNRFEVERAGKKGSELLRTQHNFIVSHIIMQSVMEPTEQQQTEQLCL